MHNKKPLLIVTLFAISFLFLFLSCNQVTQKKTLVIRNVNDGESLTADILDYWSIGSGDDMEEFEETPSYSVPVEVSYFVGGNGLPSLITFAQITDYTVTFKDVTPLDQGGTPITFTHRISGGCSFLVESDPEGGNTEEGIITVLTREWILLYFGELEDGKTLSATITLKGTDSGSGEDIEGKGSLLINIADFEDDPRTKGQ